MLLVPSELVLFPTSQPHCTIHCPENVFEEVAAMKAKFPKMKEVFFDDDTFTADPPRARKIAQLLRPLGITWSTNSRANVEEVARRMKAIKW